MICRTGVQDRLKIRLDALVELPFKNSGLLLRLGAFPTCKCLRNECCTLADEAQSTILARAANAPGKQRSASQSNQQLWGRIPDAELAQSSGGAELLENR